MTDASDWEYFKDYLERYRPLIESTAVREELGLFKEDIFQVVSLRVWRNKKRGIIADYKLLTTVLRSVMIDFHRREKHRKGDLSLDALPEHALPRTDEQEFDRALERMEDRDLMGGLIRYLATTERIIIEMHYWGHYTVLDIAQARQVAPATVKSTLKRALRKLHRWYEEWRLGGGASPVERPQVMDCPCFLCDPPAGIAVLHGPEGRVVLRNPGGAGVATFLRPCTTCKRMCAFRPK